MRRFANVPRYQGDHINSLDGRQFRNSYIRMQQEFDNRQQMRIARRMLTKTIEILAPLFADVLIICAAGNHGERRTNGKANTTFGDNADLELFENVSEIFSKSEATIISVI